jgi:hypothetical protein
MEAQQNTLPINTQIPSSPTMVFLKSPTRDPLQLACLRGLWQPWFLSLNQSYQTATSTGPR